MMAAFGIPERDMVLLIKNHHGKPIDPKTLRKHFRPALDSGLLKANVKVIGGMFKNATTPTLQNPGGNPIVQIYWTKARLGWRDRAILGIEAELPPPNQEQEDEPLTKFELARRIAFTLTISAEPQAPKPPAKKSTTV